MSRAHRGGFWGQPHQKWEWMGCLSCLEVEEVWRMWKIWMRRRLIPRKPLFSKLKRPCPAVSKHANGVQHLTRIFLSVFIKSRVIGLHSHLVVNVHCLGS